MNDTNKDWKLKLRYGKSTTPFLHYSIIGEGKVEELLDGFECPKGSAFMGMKVWAESIDEAADVFQSIAEQIGFIITGKIQIYSTDPLEPPEENPYGYDITFTPFQT